ncbi:MAG: hypothetical protein ACK5T0_04695 [Vampirovibrionales bacterium]
MNFGKGLSLSVLATVASLATHVSPVKADIMQNIRPSINGVGQHTSDLNRDTFQRISNFACRVVNLANNGKKTLEGPYLLPEKTEAEAQKLCDEFANKNIERNPLINNSDRIIGEIKDLGNEDLSIPETH